MQMRTLFLAALVAAGTLTACSDETKDKSKEAAASAAKDVKETAAATADKAKEVAGEAKEAAGAAMDSAKEAAGAAMDGAKEAAGEAVDAAKAHVHEAASSVAEATTPVPEGEKPPVEMPAGDAPAGSGQ